MPHGKPTPPEWYDTEPTPRSREQMRRRYGPDYEKNVEADVERLRKHLEDKPEK